MIQFPRDVKPTTCKTKTNTVVAETQHGTVKIPVRTPVTPKRKEEPRRTIK